MSYLVKNEVTYYSDFKSLKSITTPVISNNVNMMFGGYFDKNNEIINNFDNIGYGLTKTRNNQGLIYCKDSSQLFSMEEGYLKLIISFPDKFKNGVYNRLIKSKNILNEYFLWGINYGKNECSLPSINCYLTKRGISFNLWSSWANFSIYNNFLNLDQNEFISMEFLWDKNGIDDYIDNDYIPTMAMLIDGVICLGNPPIYSNSVKDLYFHYLDNSYRMNNLECSIKSLITRNRKEIYIIDDSSSSSSDSSSSSSSLSSSSSVSMSEESSSSGPKNIIQWGYFNNIPPKGDNFIQISSGAFDSLALTSDGKLWKWEYNGRYQIAGDFKISQSKSISINDVWLLAIREDGSIYQDTYYNPPAGNDFIKVVAGAYHSLALKSNGEVVGWGLDENGNTVVPIGETNNFIDIAAERSSFAIRADGSILHWGLFESQFTPPAGNDFIKISAYAGLLSYSGVAMALRSNGEIVVWGYETHGQITNKPSGNGFSDISCGLFHCLALKNGEIYAWGDDNYQKVSGKPSGNNFIDICAGGENSSALRS
jgi:hypothetical protein